MSFNQYEKYHLHDHVDKKGTSYNKQEVDNKLVLLKSEITTLIQSSIQTALNKFSSDFRKALIKFRNQQIRDRVGRKSLSIPKTNYTWIKLLDSSELKVTTLQEIVIQNVYIRHNDRYHHAKSDLVANSFDQLEFFFKDDFLAYLLLFQWSSI